MTPLSNSEAKRLIKEGGVKINGQITTDSNILVPPQDGSEVIIQIGKRHFWRLITREGRLKQLWQRLKNSSYFKNINIVEVYE